MDRTHVWLRESSHTSGKFPATRGILRRQPPKVAIRRPAPRSQGCEVRASSVMFDTGERAKCPEKNRERRGLNAEDAERNAQSSPRRRVDLNSLPASNVFLLGWRVRNIRK